MRSSWCWMGAFCAACAPGPQTPAGDETDASDGSGTTTQTPATFDSAPTGDASDGDTSSSAGTTGTDGDTEETEGSTATPCEDFLAFVGELESAPAADRSALLDAWTREAAYSELGLPLRCPDGWGFVGRIDAGTVAVAGEFNAWDPAANPLERPIEGLDLVYGFVTVDDPDVGSAYKFVTEGSNFVADPSSRRFGWDDFGQYSLTAPRAGRAHHERWPDFQESIGELAPRTVTVWVPPDAEAGPPLPVLYLHDGQNLFDPDAFSGGWQASATAEAMVAADLVTPLLMVGIDNTPARLDEYSHTTFQVGRATVGGRGDEYVEFLVSGVMPFIHERYPASEDAGVAGSSMGGLISLYAAWLHPETFGFAGSMSGTLDWGAPENATMQTLYEGDPPSGVFILLDSGGNGPCEGGASGSDNYCATLRMRDALMGLGWEEDVDVRYEWVPDAPHDESAWAARFDVLLETWPGPG